MRSLPTPVSLQNANSPITAAPLHCAEPWAKCPGHRACQRQTDRQSLALTHGNRTSMRWAYLNQLGIEGFLSLWRPAFFCTLGPVPKPAMTVVQPENGLRGWKEITAQLAGPGP